MYEADDNVGDAFEEGTELSTMITSFTEGTKCTWPFCTMNNFDALLEEDDAKSQFFAFAPLVMANEKDAWEQYTWQNQGWIAKDLYHRGPEYYSAGGSNTTKLIAKKIAKKIFDVSELHPDAGLHHQESDRGEEEEEEEEYQYYVPLWQVAPVVVDNRIVNANIASHPVFRQLIEIVLQTGEPALSENFDLNWLLEYSDGFVPDDHPKSAIVSPIWDGIKQDRTKVVGFTIGMLSWDAFFEGLLEPEDEPILVEIETSLGTSFSYHLSGTGNEFLGYLSAGEEHPYHNEVGHHLKVIEALEYKYYCGDYDYLRHGHKGDHWCSYKVHVHGTKEFYYSFHGSEPITYTCIVVAVFVFTILVFLLYDYMVWRRQRKLLRKAKISNAVVQNIFPKAYKERIYAEAEEQARLAEKLQGRGGFGLRTKKLMTDFLSGDSNKGSSTQLPITQLPIADLWMEASVCIADIVGKDAVADI